MRKLAAVTLGIAVLAVAASLLILPEMKIKFDCSPNTDCSSTAVELFLNDLAHKPVTVALTVGAFLTALSGVFWLLSRRKSPAPPVAPPA